MLSWVDMKEILQPRRQDEPNKEELCITKTRLYNFDPLNPTFI